MLDAAIALTLPVEASFSTSDFAREAEAGGVFRLWRARSDAARRGGTRLGHRSVTAFLAAARSGQRLATLGHQPDGQGVGFPTRRDRRGCRPDKPGRTCRYYRSRRRAGIAKNDYSPHREALAPRAAMPATGQSWWSMRPLSL